jgi:hypothetical protein
MKEKELRIALVCSGGISLSIYMHGISKEILKLVRASKSLHSIVDRHARSAASFFDYADVTDPEYDTDATYFELLQHLGTDLELRVVVDVIAGASAGGINGTMLARALSHGRCASFGSIMPTLTIFLRRRPRRKPGASGFSSHCSGCWVQAGHGRRSRTGSCAGNCRFLFARDGSRNR